MYIKYVFNNWCMQHQDSPGRPPGYLNRVRRPARAWFLEIAFVRKSVCVDVCVSAPQAMKDYSREMKSK